mgnify:CR=1 FL=1|tara:strand:- start:17348 stop:18520 length:1173 start_codon:yes stop_codon:yes gene_type:complete
MKARKRVVQGGTSAGKTYAIVPVLIDRALKSKLKITCVAESIPAVKDGCVDIFKEVMQDTGRWNDSSWLGNPMEYKFSNGSRIQFKSFDTVGKAKAGGKRDILFINEANHIAFPIADALMIRSKETYIDFNPDNTFWAHDEVLTEPNSELLVLTYEDNEGLPKETLEDMLTKKGKAFYNIDLKGDDLLADSNIKNNYWSNWWRVYGLGQIGSLQGVVFDNWTQVDNIPSGAKLIAYGKDFGYSNDPTTLTAIYEFNDAYYFDELIYRTGMLNSDIINEYKRLDVDKKVKIYADSADPKSIAEIKKAGWNIIGADKGKDSINFGIQKMQDKPFYVTSRSVNVIKELRSYKWDVDKTGAKLNTPIDYFNHSIDGIRYYFTTTAKVTGKYFGL